MGAMTRTKKQAGRKSSEPRMKLKSPKTPDLTGMQARRRPPEAPDRGILGTEAPEVRHAEAPDRGEGREALLASDFTEGRSQS